jgi:glycosyltransferase involved in cell wall biosynthesis
MESNKPLVSIIMNCYNGERYLREAIESVIGQNYHNWELIFWDNQSEDSSAEIFTSYKDPRLRYFLAPNHTSLGEARNLGAFQAQGEWIGFLDCDDRWLSKKLDYQVDIINSHGDSLGLVYGKMRVIYEDSEPEGEWGRSILKYKTRRPLLRRLPEGNIFDTLIMINYIPLSAALVRRNMYIDLGGIRPDFSQVEDYDLFLKIAKNSDVRAIQEDIIEYRVHSSNLSSLLPKDAWNKERLSLKSQYLPDPKAKFAIKMIGTINAIDEFKAGRLLDALNTLSKKGSLQSLIWLMYVKTFGRFPPSNY